MFTKVYRLKMVNQSYLNTGRAGGLHGVNECTHHNSADSVPTSNLVCIQEVVTRITFCVAGIIYYTCNLVTDIQCTCYKNAFNEHF